VDSVEGELRLADIRKLLISFQAGQSLEARLECLILIFPRLIG